MASIRSWIASLFRRSQPQTPVEVEDASGLAEQLESQGFFKYAAPPSVPGLKQEFRASGWTAVYGETGRMFRADAEDLTENGVVRFLRDIEPFLNRQGVLLMQSEDEFLDQGYWVVVNGARYRIWDDDDLQCEGKHPGHTWGVSGARTFKIVNDLLEQTGSDERLYAVNGGNDLFGFFLTQQLKELICRYATGTPSDKPYELSETPPRYGEPPD